MSKSYRLFTLFLFVFALYSNAQEMEDLDLRDFGIPYVLKVPRGAKAVEQSWGEIDVTLGDKFQMIVWRQSDSTVISRRKEVEASDLNKLRRFVTNEDKFIFYESGIASFNAYSYHFDMVKSYGGVNYYFGDIRGPFFSEKDVRLMIESVQQGHYEKFGPPV